MPEDMLSGDICRVCRSEGAADRPLFHPCICTGSIKWIHQDCLMQWMRYSRKEYCELCGHRFSFTPIYSPDMPRRLPLRDVVGGLCASVVTAMKYWMHYTLVAVAWLGIVPLTACRTYRAVFSGSLDLVKLMSLPMDMLSTENISSDIFHGCFVISCTLFTFLGLVWLREQILHAGGPDWLERENPPLPPVDNPAPAAVEQPNNQGAARGAQDNNNVPPFAEEPRDDAEIEPLRIFRNVRQVRWNNRPRIEHDPAEDAGDEGESDEEENNQAVGGGGPAVAAAAAVADAAADQQQAQQPLQQQQQANEWRDPPQGEAEEANWNPMEWDRPAEELTWERLLGLDGSLLFLEHVFWVMSLNTLFILFFAFLPYRVGYSTISLLGGEELVVASHFEGPVTTLVGYCVVGMCLIVLHAIAAVLGFQRSQRILGLGYVIVKVSLLSVVEIGVLPLVCGWWLDICSLAMFDATLRDRETSFRMAPGTSMFIHWLIGMIYVYYFASFILLLREILRPGVLWFLRNLNDPDFSPLQEMIHLPILRHARRLVASAIIFGSAILLILWLPIKILRSLLPGFLPYTVTVQAETQINELSLELLLLQVVLPALLEQSHTRTWLKSLVRGWCRSIAWLLNLQSYLLPQPRNDEAPAADEPAEPINNHNNDLGAAHQALLNREGPMGYQPYVRPKWFGARLVGLMVCVCVSLVLASLIAMTLPVWIGRRVMAVWVVGAPAPSPPILPPAYIPAASKDDTNPVVSVLSETRVHEVYTIACGTYLCWAAARTLALAMSWLPRGRRAILERIKHWVYIGCKAYVSFVLLFGIIPLLFGLLLELVVVVPLRVPLEQSPILFVWQDWALGVLYTKIATAVTMMGPDWHLKFTIERAYNDGIRDMDLRFIIQNLAAPVICVFGLALAIPYVIANGLVPLFITNAPMQIVIARRIYPFVLVMGIFIAVISVQITSFKKLYEHIKNDKYLVGQRLVNYEHRNRQQQAQEQQEQAVDS
ncbi:E3 ubiquitin-protein ligase MARCH6 [Trichogramma pretiosum]|uniref:E3 ubiquitin-protein ligase MARCH6 n=1 Tax=Trichogramma pretiosum TaxID=7493 RepID=UPI0006C9417A|nr:E3 ubiquitin-protein ligase MARCH6 [Trichogramma pretiosum]XP_014238069.1 E3 ubiquitin-protein ligase MARCH6 [Trichogramma pretiosum]